MQPLCGTPLTFHYGESTGLFIGEDELRIGHEPGGYRVVLSEGKGEFPIRPLLYEGQEKLISDYTVAMQDARDAHASYQG
jgi:hypothetical protein